MHRKTQSLSAPVNDLLRQATTQSRDDLLVFKAASALGKRPKRVKRSWTGWLLGTHLWKGRPVWTPTGQLAQVVCALRGRVVVRWDDLKSIDGEAFQLFRADELRLYKMPAAVLLGRRKLGKREKPSVLKSAASRANGSRPCHPGRMRGRPRRSGLMPPADD